MAAAAAPHGCVAPARPDGPARAGARKGDASGAPCRPSGPRHDRVRRRGPGTSSPPTWSPGCSGDCSPMRRWRLVTGLYDRSLARRRTVLPAGGGGSEWSPPPDAQPALADRAGAGWCSRGRRWARAGLLEALVLQCGVTGGEIAGARDTLADSGRERHRQVTGMRRHRPRRRVAGPDGVQVWHEMLTRLPDARAGADEALPRSTQANATAVIPSAARVEPRGGGTGPMARTTGVRAPSGGRDDPSADAEECAASSGQAGRPRPVLTVHRWFCSTVRPPRVPPPTRKVEHPGDVPRSSPAGQRRSERRVTPRGGWPG